MPPSILRRSSARRRTSPSPSGSPSAWSPRTGSASQMGAIHYNGNPSGSDAALYTSSGVLTPLKEIVACNAGAGDATITLSVHRAISAVVEPVATALLVRVGHARSLVAGLYEPLGEILLDQGDSLHGSATSVAPAAPGGLAVPTAA